VKLNDDILKKFPYLKYLDLRSSEVTNLDSLNLIKLNILNNYVNLNHMTNLKILHIRPPCIMSIDHINGISYMTTLEKLDVYGNSQITDINCLVNLKKLNAGGYHCGINDSGIKNLNLIKLITTGNPKIKNINHMTNLKKLSACGPTCGLSDYGIKDLKLTKLKSNQNFKITVKIL
jgi:hypothetical protein